MPQASQYELKAWTLMLYDTRSCPKNCVLQFLGFGVGFRVWPNIFLDLRVQFPAHHAQKAEKAPHGTRGTQGFGAPGLNMSTTYR